MSPLITNTIAPAKEAAIRAARERGSGMLKIAREWQTATAVVQRIKAAMGAP